MNLTGSVHSLCPLPSGAQAITPPTCPQLPGAPTASSPATPHAVHAANPWSELTAAFLDLPPWPLPPAQELSSFSGAVPCGAMLSDHLSWVGATHLPLQAASSAPPAASRDPVPCSRPPGLPALAQVTLPHHPTPSGPLPGWPLWTLTPRRLCPCATSQEPQMTHYQSPAPTTPSP